MSPDTSANHTALDSSKSHRHQIYREQCQRKKDSGRERTGGTLEQTKDTPATFAEPSGSAVVTGR